MKYIFPVIEHIDQIRHALAGREEFIEARRDGFVVFDYRYVMDDSFPAVAPGAADDAEREIAMLRREARGLIGDPRTGRVLGRRFHKFFNLGERPETQPHVVDLGQEHVVLDKLDGSMVSPFRLDGRLGDGLLWATMLGETDIARKAATFAAGHPGYAALANELLDAGANPVFEWCSRDNRVVIDHPQPRLVLLAIRELVSGAYWPWPALVEAARRHDLPLVGAWGDAPREVQAFLAHARAFDDREGYVVRFGDGHMLKLKTDWYTRIHALKDDLQQEKNVVALVLHGQVDDVLPHLLPDEAAALVVFADAVRRGIAASAADLRERAAALRAAHPARREQALAIRGDPDSGLLFRVLDGHDPQALVSQLVLRETLSAPRLEAVRRLFGATWRGIAGTSE